ncbi:hypothetical protein O181_099035 [Austropuccinia psidii MF-1]|uniref:Integrase catalytic domain-containing protein n=1 Tax=Austropuccinia psidii MF-1 TaxID=1389203 RepID=A0A9Q3JAC0_9BASI|nr:hypothetical protein [Austropuccinia psidii MF-1]
MDWVTALPPGGDRSYNACLVLVDRYSKTIMFLRCNNNDTEISFSTAYHPQTDGLAEIMIQKLEDMIRRFCAYGLKFKDSDGFTHDWYRLIPALELAYETSIHSSTGKTPAMIEEGWNPRLPYDTLKKGFSGYTNNSKQLQVNASQSKTPCQQMYARFFQVCKRMMG